jgi:hypothetical protein
MKRTLLLGSLAAIAILFFSWRNHHDPDKNPAPAPVATQGGGHAVPMAYIKPCLNEYKAVMKKYGITEDNPRKPITKCPDSTFLITLSESFHADSLVAWLNSQIQEYDPQGKGANLNFVVMPGICTAQMVGAVKGPKASTGRISYFIVAQPRAGGKSKMTPGGDPGSGFEVGGLQP